MELENGVGVPAVDTRRLSFFPNNKKKKLLVKPVERNLRNCLMLDMRECIIQFLSSYFLKFPPSPFSLCLSISFMNVKVFTFHFERRLFCFSSRINGFLVQGLQ